MQTVPRPQLSAEEMEKKRLSWIYYSLYSKLSNNDKNDLEFETVNINWENLHNNGYKKKFNKTLERYSDQLNYRKFSDEELERFEKMGYPSINGIQEHAIIIGLKQKDLIAKEEIEKQNNTYVGVIRHLYAYLPLETVPFSVMQRITFPKFYINGEIMQHLFGIISDSIFEQERFSTWFENDFYMESKVGQSDSYDIRYEGYLIQFEKLKPRRIEDPTSIYNNTHHVFSLRIPNLSLFFPFPSEICTTNPMNYIKRHHSNTFVVIENEFASAYFSFVYDFFKKLNGEFKLVPVSRFLGDKKAYVTYAKRDEIEYENFKIKFYYDFLNRSFDFEAIDPQTKFMFQISCHYGYRGADIDYRNKSWYSQEIQPDVDLESTNYIDLDTMKNATKQELDEMKKDIKQKKDAIIQQDKKYKTELQKGRTLEVQSTETFLTNIYNKLETEHVKFGIMFQVMYLKLKEKWYFLDGLKDNQSIKIRKELGAEYKKHVDNDYHDFFYFELALAEAIWGFNPYEIPFPKVTHARKMLRFLVQEIANFDAVTETYAALKHFEQKL